MVDLFQNTEHGPEHTTPVKRQWWPEYYADEAMPGGTDHPDQWIRGAEGNEWLIGPVDEEGYAPFTTPADQELAFVWYEPRGRCEITVRQDGSFDLHGREPEDWSLVWKDDDGEMVGDTLKDYAENFAWFLEPGEEERHDIIFGKWDQTVLRLVVEDGKARFVPQELPQST